MSNLVGSETRRILAQCGLLETADRIRAYGPLASGPPMSADPSLPLTMISEQLRAMFVAVSAPDAVPENEQLVTPRLRVETSRRIASMLAAEYSAVYNAVAEPANGYIQAGGIASIKNTPAQLRTVLGLADDVPT